LLYWREIEWTKKSEINEKIIRKRLEYASTMAPEKSWASLPTLRPKPLKTGRMITKREWLFSVIFRVRMESLSNVCCHKNHISTLDLREIRTKKCKLTLNLNCKRSNPLRWLRKLICKKLITFRGGRNNI